MGIFPAQRLLSPGQDVLPDQEFLLPICTTRQRLARMLSCLWDGRTAIPDPDDEESPNTDDLSHMIDVLEALAYINDPENAWCYEPLVGDGEDCTEFLPEVGFIDYAPNDPFQTPDLIPEGYLLPPWYNNPALPLPGVLPTDAMVNFLSIGVFGDLGGLLMSGLPRMRINFIGAGELEIEFVKVVQGGYALIVLDGNPLSNKVIDLDAFTVIGTDVIDSIFGIVIEQNLNQTETVEIQTLTEGAHYVDITFLPKISVETIAGFGGGIRRVSLCGLSAEGTGSMPQFQVVNGCVLQWRPNASASWQTLANICGEDAANIQLQDGGAQLQVAYDDPPTWQNVPGANYLPRDGREPVLGSLEIFGQASDHIQLDLRAANNQTAPLQANRNPGGQVTSGWTPNGDLNVGGYPVRETTRVWVENGQPWQPNIQLFNFASSGEGVGLLSEVIGGGGALHAAIRARASGAANNYGVWIESLSAGANDFGLVQNGQPAKNLLVGDLGIGRTPQHMLDVTRYSSDPTSIFNIGRFGRGRSTGTGAVGGMGIALLFTLNSSVVEDRQAARLVTLWQDPTDATRTGRMDLRANHINTEVVGVSVSASGAQSAISFHGAMPQPRPVVAGDWQGNGAGKALAQALAAYGLITDATITGTPPEPPEPDLNVDRCRVAKGAMRYLIDSVYAQAVMLVYEVAGSPLGTASAIYVELDLIGRGAGSVLEWQEALSAVYAAPANAVTHTTWLQNRFSELAQLYYCALNADGTLSEIGYQTFLASIGGETAPPYTDPGLFRLFINILGYEDFAILNAHGYFYTNEDCTGLDVVNCAEAWERGYGVDTFAWPSVWNLSGNSIGWNGNTPGIVFVAEQIDPAIVSTVSIRYSITAQNGYTLSVVDIQSGQTRRSWSGQTASNVTVTWEAASVDDYCNQGVRIQMSYQGNQFGQASFGIQCVNLAGQGTPPDGQSTLCS